MVVTVDGRELQLRVLVEWVLEICCERWLRCVV